MPSLLHRLATTNNIAEMQALLEAGADLNALDDDGKTPLHLAAISGHSEVIQSLQPVVNQDPPLMSLIHELLEKGYYGTLKWVLRHPIMTPRYLSTQLATDAGQTMLTTLQTLDPLSQYTATFKCMQLLYPMVVAFSGTTFTPRCRALEAEAHTLAKNYRFFQDATPPALDYRKIYDWQLLFPTERVRSMLCSTTPPLPLEIVENILQQ